MPWADMLRPRWGEQRVLPESSRVTWNRLMAIAFSDIVWRPRRWIFRVILRSDRYGKIELALTAIV